ncbi:MAG: hypothetical protein DHS80DRAFT_33122 [Piptocephalis tieghemiana]|nr:MAG: hypothetical protein DHS80DRAFT_33122 [Piptocephalis tieghemiana]
MSKGHKGQWRKDSSGEPRGRIHEATEKREGIGEEEEEMTSWTLAAVALVLTCLMASQTQAAPAIAGGSKATATASRFTPSRW